MRARPTDLPDAYDPSTAAPAQGGFLRRHRFWIAALLAGMVLRLALLPLAPRYGYTWDHDDVVRWGIQAADQGVLTLYDVPARRHDIRLWENGSWVLRRRETNRFLVYPPLFAYVTLAGGVVHAWVSQDRIVNTLTSRVVFGIAPLLSDILLAFGCAALAGALGAGRAARWVFVAVLFAPPIWWDSALWGQLDSAVTAAAVWMVWAMCSGRWKEAGVLFGAALMLKPQALVLSPVWLYALWAHRARAEPLRGLVLAAATVVVLSLPFLWHSGLAWWRISYLENLTTAFPATTLKAFNLWYGEALLHESVDVARSWLGLSMDTWGRVLFAAALAASLVGLWRRWRGAPYALLLCAALSTLLSVMLATRVHERYLLLALPFVIVAAAVQRRVLVALVPLLVVATAQLATPLWLETDPGDWAPTEAAARAQHDSEMAALPPEQRSAARSFEERLAPTRETYLATRAPTLALEWAMVLLALTGTAALVDAAVRR